MSTALAYNEPNRFSAGVLALVVHLAFFIVLYFGVHWQSQSSSKFTVEMWDSLPNTEVVPAHEPTPTPPVQAPPPPKIEPMPVAKPLAPVLPPVKAEIEIREKKIKKKDAEQKMIQADEKKQKAEARARQDAALTAYTEKQEQKRRQAEQARQAEQVRIRAEVSAATQSQVDLYQDRIRNKIRSKMKKVADVPDSAEAIFAVTLLPDGMLMDDPKLIKSSGIPAYDDAAERAILLAEPLPVPTDIALQKMFRELKLSIKP